jgi:hypothetical protein
VTELQYPPYPGHEPLYGAHPADQYQAHYQQYDPNMSNSVFEDGEDGYGVTGLDYPHGMTPLPGTLGSSGHTPQPREAPRAVFDDEEEQEPVPPGHPRGPKASVGSQDHNRNQTQTIGLFYFVLNSFEGFL